MTTTPELDRLQKQRDEAYAEVQANPGNFAILDKWVKIDNLVNRKGREWSAAQKAARKA
jgi:hypothetical protein